MSQPTIAARLVSQGDSVSISAASFGNSPIRIRGLTVNTGAASAIVRVYGGQASTATSMIAKVDATTAAGTTPRNTNMFDVECQTGFTAWLGGGDADVTIYYTVRI